MSARPRPRPRPRPAPVAAPAPPPSPPKDTPSSPSSVGASSPTVVNVDDEDALFIRNRSRTTLAWKKFDELDKKAVRRRTPDSSSSDEEEDMSPRSRKYKKKSEKDVLPSWTKNKDFVRLLSVDDDDDGIELIDAAESTPKPKVKRPRSRTRSRSITPPPELTMHQIQQARNIVRQTLEVPRRPRSPTLILDDSGDTTVLDPELAKIAQAIRNETSQSKSFKAESSELSGGPEVVTIKVKWKPHPLIHGARPEAWAFEMKRFDTFRHIFEEIADMASVLSDKLIISYKNARLFPSATPNSLKIWAEAELEACDKTTHEYLRTQCSRSPSATPDHGDQADSASSHLSDEESTFESETESVAGEKFKLILRSAITIKDITLTVRPTTTCGAIVKAFLNSAGLMSKYPNVARKKGGAGGPMLQIDGDKMDPSDAIGDAGLEDGDCVDVVGL